LLFIVIFFLSFFVDLDTDTESSTSDSEYSDEQLQIDTIIEPSSNKIRLKFKPAEIEQESNEDEQMDEEQQIEQEQKRGTSKINKKQTISIQKFRIC
jgi:hypothetical protein